jgi:hypothetical protein
MFLNLLIVEHGVICMVDLLVVGMFIFLVLLGGGLFFYLLGKGIERAKIKNEDEEED